MRISLGLNPAHFKDFLTYGLKPVPFRASKVTCRRAGLSPVLRVILKSPARDIAAPAESCTYG